MNAIETRKLAQSLGIKNVAKFRTAELQAQIAEIQAAQAAEAAKVEAQAREAAKAATAPVSRKGKTCIICNQRPGMTAAQLKAEGIGRDFADQCLPCHTEAGWENTHSDYGHEEILAYLASDKGAGTSAPTFMTDDIKADMAECWICRPELNKASADYQARKGTSRVGMTLVVPVRASGAEKAAAVQGQLPTGLKVIVKSTKTHTALGIEGDGFKVALLWDATGAYAYAESFIQETGNRKIKVRNAKAALAFIAKRAK